MSPIINKSHIPSPLVILKDVNQPLQSPISTTSVSIKQEMTSTALTPTHLSLKTQDDNVSRKQAKLKPKSNAPLSHLLNGIFFIFHF